MHLGDGSYRQRLLASEAATEAARESRRLRVALQTFETLRLFEDQARQAQDRAYDDIPSEALPMRWSATVRGMAGMASEPQLGTQAVLTHENGTERDPRRLRPPGPRDAKAQLQRVLRDEVSI